MKFVTSAYKKKLMEQKKWELQQQLEDEREQRNDVTKTGMSGYVRTIHKIKFARICSRMRAIDYNFYVCMYVCTATFSPS